MQSAHLEHFITRATPFQTLPEHTGVETPKPKRYRLTNHTCTPSAT